MKELCVVRVRHTPYIDKFVIEICALPEIVYRSAKFIRYLGLKAFVYCFSCDLKLV